MDSEPTKEVQFIGPYRVEQQIGKGGMAVVRLGLHVGTESEQGNTHSKVAIKMISKTKLVNEKEQNSMAREITIMKLLYHPNILQLFDIYEDVGRIYLITEYCAGGDLYHYLLNDGPLSGTEAAILFNQLLDAVEFCHENRIVHRDLKPENILLSENKKRILLSDFGLSRGMHGSTQFLKTRCGSLHYLSPEVAKGDPYDSKADIWSLGIILYAMVTASLPFDGETPLEILKKVVKGQFTFPVILSKKLQHLIYSMLIIDPEERTTIPLIRESAWMTTYIRPGSNIPHRSPRILPLTSQDLMTHQHILKSLQLLGWEEGELKELLLAEEPNDAKLFFALLRDRQSSGIKPKQVTNEGESLKKSPIRRRAVSASSGTLKRVDPNRSKGSRDDEARPSQSKNSTPEKTSASDTPDSPKEKDRIPSFMRKKKRSSSDAEPRDKLKDSKSSSAAQSDESKLKVQKFREQREKDKEQKEKEEPRTESKRSSREEGTATDSRTESTPKRSHSSKDTRKRDKHSADLREALDKVVKESSSGQNSRDTTPKSSIRFRKKDTPEPVVNGSDLVKEDLISNVKSRLDDIRESDGSSERISVEKKEVREDPKPKPTKQPIVEKQRLRSQSASIISRRKVFDSPSPQKNSSDSPTGSLFSNLLSTGKEKDGGSTPNMKKKRSSTDK